MTESITAYPLCWPTGWRRMPDHQRTTARFSAKAWRGNSWDAGSHRVKSSLSVSQATKRLTETLERMNARGFVLSTDIPVRLDGLLRSRARTPDDPGVAVYWNTRKAKAQRCIAVDRYDNVAGNIAAIAATLEAMRSIERHGGAEILDRAFTGFTALPSPEQWWHVLGFDTMHVSADDIQKRYRELAQAHHPDKPGGDDQQMASAEQDITYHKEKHAEEVDRVEGRNTWLKQLRESL